MKRRNIFCLCIAVLLVFGLAGCGAGERSDIVSESEGVYDSHLDNAGFETEETGSDSQEMIDTGNNGTASGSNILIAYFSVPEDVETTDAVSGASIVVRDNEKMGNTEYVAKVIQQTIGGDLFRIETVDQYPLDHDPLVDQAAEEQDENKRPELLHHVENFEKYETIILGYPNWWADLPMPVYTFLEEYDFGAKTIIPFVTHGGSGFSGTIETISELQPGAHVSGNTLSLSRNSVADSEEKVISWAESLGLQAAASVPERDGDTVASAEADPVNQQILYLWEEGNMPAVTQYTENNGNYADDPDFRPYMVTFPVPEDTEVKGAVLINAGGAFQFRSLIREFEECVEALGVAGVPVEVNVLEGRPHGYGYMEGWIPDYDAWLTEIFENN